MWEKNNLPLGYPLCISPLILTLCPIVLVLGHLLSILLLLLTLTIYPIYALHNVMNLYKRVPNLG